MLVRVKIIIAVSTLAFGTAACSSFVIPKRGFVTRYFAGSALQNSVHTTDDFVGRPIHPAIDSYVGAAATAVSPGASGSARMSTSMAQTVRTCELAAHQRASDIAFQGFGEATQKSVFDSTYADCITWRTNH
jgi:hypothetical protein